jgi:EmrB/QacA subfamily drug resistance transporter
MSDVHTTAAPIPAPSVAGDGSRLARLRASRWLPLPVLLTGTFLIVLDFFIVNVALPSLQRDLHATPATLEWVVAGYGLTFAVLMLAAGRLGDRIGRRRVFALGVAAFTIASLGCGVAPNGEALVLARLVQGASGALIQPTVLALITTLYVGAERARAIGAYATVMGVAAAGGQLIGGVLLHLDVAGLSWRAVFLVNVLVGLLMLAAVPVCVPPSPARSRARIDVVGLLLATATLTALLLPLLEGRQQGWPWWSVTSLAAAPVLAAGFALWQRRALRRGDSPLVVPDWFRDASFRRGVLTQFGFWCGQASYFLVLALYLQVGRGLSPLQAGLVFTVLATAYLAASMRAPRLTARFGRSVIVAGAIALVAGHLAELLAASTDAALPAIVPGLLLTGAGMGLCLAPITAIVLATVEPERAGAVSGLLGTVQQVGNAVGVAVVGVVFFGAVGRGYPYAFSVSVAVLAALLAGVAVCAVRLPSTRHTVR